MLPAHGIAFKAGVAGTSRTAGRRVDQPDASRAWARRIMTEDRSLPWSQS